MKTMRVINDIPTEWYMRLASLPASIEGGVKDAVMRAIQTYVFLNEKQAEGYSFMVGKAGEENWISVEVR